MLPLLSYSFLSMSLGIPPHVQSLSIKHAIKLMQRWQLEFSLDQPATDIRRMTDDSLSGPFKLEEANDYELDSSHVKAALKWLRTTNHNKGVLSSMIDDTPSMLLCFEHSSKHTIRIYGFVPSPYTSADEHNESYRALVLYIVDQGMEMGKNICFCFHSV